MEFHQDPYAMAKSLATYIADPKRIQSEVLAAFGSCPHQSKILEFRGIHERAIEAGKQWAATQPDHAQTDRDRRYADRMEAASRALAMRIIEVREMAA